VSASEYLPKSLSEAARFLTEELRPFPGRANVALRCVLSSALVMINSMALSVPLLALSLLVVFYVTQANVVLTRLVGVLFIIGATVGIGLATFVLKCTFDYPLLRILLASAIFFLSVYLMRVSKLGVAFFIVALVVIYAQTFVDRTDQAELLVRALLWTWVATTYPIALTLIINTLLLPAEPLEQLKAAMASQLHSVDAQLHALSERTGEAPVPGARDVHRGVLTLQKLLRFVAMRDPAWRRHEARQLAYVAAVSRLYTASSLLGMTSLSEKGRADLEAVRGACNGLQRSIATGTPFVAPESLRALQGEELPAPLVEMRSALLALSDRLAMPEALESAAERERLLVPDAFHNPVYLQFALKTLLCVLLCYVLYTAVDWPGIHTVMLTCLIVAQPSLGAIQQRAVLRVVGAALGSVLALVMMIFVVPRLDDIVGLLLIALPVIAVGAWTNAGSERISYAGVQLMFTFSMALLDRFGPTTDLTEIRDRAIGILLGVAVSTLVHGALWPEGESEALRQRVAKMLRGLAEHLKSFATHPTLSPQISLDTRPSRNTTLSSELGDCEAMAARVALEPGWQWGEGQQELFNLRMQTIIAQTHELLLASQAIELQLRLPSRTAVEIAESTRAAQGASNALEGYATAMADDPLHVKVPASTASVPGHATPGERRLWQAIASLPAWPEETPPTPALNGAPNT
jgi:multidrug resistance protein MdtO